MNINAQDCILYSGGATGAETEFGALAEKYGVAEVNFTFEGHQIVRTRGIRVLTQEELRRGDVSMTYVSRLLNRTYSNAPIMRQVLQTIWYQVNSGMEIYVVGTIQDDNTVKGGTGWGAEFAKICNKPLFVYDQDKNGWFRWEQAEWQPQDAPVIGHKHFTGTGTRFLEDNGRKAIADLFVRSFV
ncbi:hypothetical protein SAMN05660653_00380 [Desulfonatronum thiosulfatophilum]|uniref:Uncharacterized protein n=1 Tax=Desulfonatronum thiosulfatophilum TaxID=617002 RepID=A0A1G6AJC6_9BACT|nr:hypothetical protein [Desulfonatronum thiosulfatophilum]SDB08223.1 hypothetical protein SAMN05660653_00380 [Desulfonatronum thiosulfatophilum]